MKMPDIPINQFTESASLGHTINGRFLLAAIKSRTQQTIGRHQSVVDDDVINQYVEEAGLSDYVLA